MAFNIHWKIKFKSLRAGTDYTVNIYKDGTLPSGYPLTLEGGAQSFVTEEDDNDDQFTPIRTQTGYIRIVDDGKAINDSNVEVAYNWKELLPLNDTDRPVTLTDGNNNVVWCGFMQAQNFGGMQLAERAATPYGEILSQEQMESLMERLLECENYRYTPDGKTITVILANNEIEQRF